MKSESGFSFAIASQPFRNKLKFLLCTVFFQEVYIPFFPSLELKKECLSFVFFSNAININYYLKVKVTHKTADSTDLNVVKT